MASSEVTIVDVSTGTFTFSRTGALRKMAPAVLPQNPVHGVGVLFLSVHDVGVEGDLDSDVILRNVVDVQSEAIVVKVGKLDVLVNIVNLLDRLVVPGGGKTLVELQRHVLEKLVGRTVVRAITVELVDNLHSIIRRSRKLDGPLDSVIFTLGKLVGAGSLNRSLDIDCIGERLALGVGGDGVSAGSRDLRRRESGLHEKVARDLVVLILHIVGVGSCEGVTLIGNSHNVVAAGILHHKVIVACFKTELVINVKGEEVAGNNTILLGTERKGVIKLPFAAGVALLVADVIGLTHSKGGDRRRHLFGSYH